MQLNEKKTKNIIFNFSRKNQFTTKLSVNQKNIEVVKEVKLLGTKITDDLKWSKNTREIVRKAYARMQLLHRASGFTSNVQDLRSIYPIYIRTGVFWNNLLFYGTVVTLKNIERTLREFKNLL